MSGKTFNDVFGPVHTYEMTRNGLRLPKTATEADAWNDLADIGAKLSLPHNPNETTSEYAKRLRQALKPYDRDQSIGGAAVYMLRLILDLYAPPTTRRKVSASHLRPLKPNQPRKKKRAGIKTETFSIPPKQDTTKETTTSKTNQPNDLTDTHPANTTQSRTSK